MLNELAITCGTRAAEKGWHDRYNNTNIYYQEQIEYVNKLEDDKVKGLEIDLARTYLSGYHTEVSEHVVAKLALITCEVAEAIEEVRAGRNFDETYYSEGNKPEGVPSELADIIIRTLDLAYMLNIDIEKIVDEKLDFNSTRPRLHGKVV